jgi:hypothetical protein
MHTFANSTQTDQCKPSPHPHSESSLPDLCRDCCLPARASQLTCTTKIYLKCCVLCGEGLGRLCQCGTCAKTKDFCWVNFILRATLFNPHLSASKYRRCASLPRPKDEQTMPVLRPIRSDTSSNTPMPWETHIACLAKDDTLGKSAACHANTAPHIRCLGQSVKYGRLS